MLDFNLMRSPRFRRIVRIIAVVLLAWTALDLTAPSLCALEADVERPGSGHAAITAAASTPPGAPVEEAHVDDCFCCSHCVEPTAVPAPSGLQFVVNRYRTLPDGIPPSPVLQLYHPPRA